MLFYSLSFLLGDIALLYSKNMLFNLSAGLWIVILFLITILIIVVTLYRLKLKFYWNIIFFILGFIWTLLYLSYQSFWSLPVDLEDHPVQILGIIASIPEYTKVHSSFILKLQKINNRSAHAKIKLNWRHSPKNLTVGDKWSLFVKLKRIHGLNNPGGFNYENWALQEGIRANGYVLNKEKNKLMEDFWFSRPIDRIRQALKNKIERNLSFSTTSPWITALAVGERHSISPSQWEILRNTGTNHLMAIAGLHIGTLAGLVYMLIRGLWRLFPNLALKLPSFHAATFVAFVMAVFYSSLAGFSIPTQRACIMLGMYSIIILTKRNYSAWIIWSIGLILVLLINPLSLLSESFYLSFGSVALIIYGTKGRLNERGLWWKWGRVQWIIAMGLFPLSIGLFHQFSFVSFIANSIAIPWVTFLILPLILIGCFFLLVSEKVGAIFLFLADKNFSYLWKILAYFSHLSWATWYHAICDPWIIIIACIGIIILFFPKGLPGRWLGIIWLLPIILSQPAKPRWGEVKFTLLDVGQGLAAVVQTYKHVLVFDTGARLNDQNDMGESVVVPFLRSISVKKLDMLVISHGDNDHIGGANAVMKSFQVKSIKTSEPEDFPPGLAEYCLRNQSWEWDGVKFQFLYPSEENLGLDNNSSCVLKVSTYRHSLLLTGDIEKLAEKYLVEHEWENLHSDILVAPHHGSKTSAEDSFIKGVNPKYVLFSVGYHNHYHLPDKNVVAKYRDLHIQQYSTVDLGAIQFNLSL